jgi:hypothetical protein
MMSQKSRTYAGKAIHSIRGSNTASTDLVRDHSAETDGYSDSGESGICCPAVEQIPKTSVDEADTERPQSHFGFFDSAVMASEEDDDGICEDASEVAENAADQSGEEHQTRGGCGEVVGFVGHDFGDCLVVSLPFDMCDKTCKAYLC